MSNGKPGDVTIRVGGWEPWGAEVEIAYTTGHDGRGRVSSTTASSAIAAWAGWPTPATKSSSRATATEKDSLHTAPCSTTKGVIDQPAKS